MAIKPDRGFPGGSSTGGASSEGYGVLMSAVIQKFIIVMGAEKTLKLAARVPGLVVGPDGRVTSEPDLDAFQQLVREYRSAAGTMSIYIMKGAIAPFLAGTKLPLPDELR